METANPRSGRRGIVRALLGLPLFFKLLIANAVIVFAAAVITASAVHELLERNAAASPWTIILTISFSALVSSVIVNALVVRTALSPIDQLTAAARRVQDGDLDARVPVSVVADRDLEELAHTLNAMLDSVAEHRARLREVASRALDAAEAERLRISRDLHDDVAQSLAATMVQLKLAREAKNPEDRDRHFAAISAALTHSIEELRTIAQELRPPALDMLGLRAALEAYARTVNSNTGLRVDLKAEAIDRQLAPHVELALYRLIQDAVTNVARHASTDAATVSLEKSDGRIIATIADRGRGFSMKDAVTRNGALGLLGMRERAAYVGGSVQFDSAPGQGTRVRIEVPTTTNGSYV